MQTYRRLPGHIGVIPDGNRRWALGRGMEKQDGYRHGVGPGFELYKECVRLGIKELTLYGFTLDNNKRPALQRRAFKQACVDAVRRLAQEDAELLVVGDADSPRFPAELKPFTTRTRLGEGRIKVNFLVNYGWNWDLAHAINNGEGGDIANRIASAGVSRIDLLIRWGGRRRLSGFLPVQTVYSDIYVIDEMWPDFSPKHLHRALMWYQEQNVTLGG